MALYSNITVIMHKTARSHSWATMRLKEMANAYLQAWNFADDKYPVTRGSNPTFQFDLADEFCMLTASISFDCDPTLQLTFVEDMKKTLENWDLEVSVSNIDYSVLDNSLDF
jgi:hypothetical protein